MSYDSSETLKFQHKSSNDGIPYQLDRNMLATTSIDSIKKNKSSAQTGLRKSNYVTVSKTFSGHVCGYGS